MMPARDAAGCAGVGIPERRPARTVARCVVDREDDVVRDADRTDLIGAATPRRPKWLWLYAAWTARPFVQVAVFGRVNGYIVAAAVIVAVLVVGVWNANRVAWAVAVGLQVVVMVPFDGDFSLYFSLWVPLGLIPLACLLAPSTRRFVLTRPPGGPRKRSSSEPLPGASA